MELLVELLSIVAPVYICVGVGYGWARAGRAYDTELITDLIMNIGAPCLVFHSLVALEADPAIMLEIGLVTVCALALFALLAGLVLRLVGLPLTSFLAPMVFPNTGNMGLPVVYFAFGEEGLALGACFFAVTAFLQFTAGQWMWTGTAAAGDVLRTPLVWSSLLAVTVLWSGWETPEWILRATSLLGGIAIPLMQLTLGVTLGSLAFARLPRSFGLSCLRIALGLGVGVLLSELFGLEGAARGVVILDCAMPVAVFNYLMAERFRRSPADVASVVMVSTLAALVTLPFVLATLLAGGVD